jgi:hypothetical protein
MIDRYRVRMTSSEAADLGIRAARELARLGACELGPGLTEAEFSRAEREYGIEFADDHRAFLSVALPLNTPIPHVEGVFHTHARPWPDWRDGSPEELRKALGWPVEGVLFDIEHGVFWDRTWGERPQDQAAALEVAEAQLAKVPRMIPIHAHRYLPGGRGTWGHPVLSMWQSDIIYYGLDLADYIQYEFGGKTINPADPDWRPQATVPFWRDCL